MKLYHKIKGILLICNKFGDHYQNQEVVRVVQSSI